MAAIRYDHAANTDRIAPAIRSRLGIYSHSWPCGNGVSQPVTRDHGRFQTPEAMFLNQRRDFRAESTCPRRFVHDDAASCLLDRTVMVAKSSGINVRKSINLCVDLHLLNCGSRHVHHRAPGDHSYLFARLHDARFAQRRAIVLVRHSASGCSRHGGTRGRITVKWTAVQSFGFEEI